MNPGQAERKPPFSMLRSFALADWLTLSNAVCGTSAIFACMMHLATGDVKHVWTAVYLLPFALLFDVLDGSVARWRRKHSALGADLDSLADIVSFGVAPAVLGFTLGLRGGLDVAALTFFVACGIGRLARYNATAEQLSGGTGKVKYYEGTPIPTSLLIVAVMGGLLATHQTGVNLWLGHVDLGWVFHPVSLIYVINGSLMISTIRIPKP